MPHHEALTRRWDVCRPLRRMEGRLTLSASGSPSPWIWLEPELELEPEPELELEAGGVMLWSSLGSREGADFDDKPSASASASSVLGAWA